MKRVLLIVGLALLAYVSTGLYFVQPEEQAVGRRFGRALPGLREPGAHFGLPRGIDRIDRLRPREVKRVTIGLAEQAVGSLPAQYLTGDRNLIGVRATVQYTIENPVRYLFETGEVEPVLAMAAEAMLTQVLSSQPVDRALTLSDRTWGASVRDRLQTLVDAYDLGIAIRSVDIGTVRPPPEVAEAFADVISALREREQQVNQAYSYANRTRAAAQADAQRLRDEANGYRNRRILEAEGEARRFEQLLAEYARAPELTARRLYLEAMAETLPRFRSKLIIDSGSNLDLSIIEAE